MDQFDIVAFKREEAATNWVDSVREKPYQVEVLASIDCSNQD